MLNSIVASEWVLFHYQTALHYYVGKANFLFDSVDFSTPATAGLFLARFYKRISLGPSQEN